MQKIVMLLGLALLSVVVACAGGRESCKTESDCANGQACLWVNDEDGLYCALRCGGGQECLSGQSCTGRASSCKACLDAIAICE